VGIKFTEARERQRGSSSGREETRAALVTQPEAEAEAAGKEN